jgi:hypothetical protein
MNKFDINKNKLNIGDVVVLCDCAEAITRRFQFYEVVNNGAGNTVLIASFHTGGKKECFNTKKLKKVNGRYKELVDKATVKKPFVPNNLEPIYPRGTKICPTCKKMNYEEQKYCGECGQRLG